MVPTGLISVIPQPCATTTPYLSRSVFTIARGTAAPPMTTSLSGARSPPTLSRWPSSIVQTVGTAAEVVTPSSLIS